MGQQVSTAYSFCCTACSACACCSHTGYDQLDQLGLMKNTHGVDYQSNGTYDIKETETEKCNTNNNNNNVTIHATERTKFRAFVIAYNKRYGYLLLRAYKKGKDLHYQLPGGHIDKSELHACSFEDAAKNAAKRELFEETGLHINDNSRLKNLKLNIKNRVYFQLLLKDTDSLSNQHTKSLDDTQQFYLKLSPSEHNGFVFEKNINKAIDMVKKHSGGKNSEALSLYALKAKHERKRSYSYSHSKSHSKSVEHKRKSSNSHKVKNKKEKRKKNKSKNEKDMSI